MTRTALPTFTKRPLARSAFAVVVSALLALTTLQSAAFADTGFTATGGRPYAATSVWNSTIKQNPALDGNSVAIASALSGGTNQQNALMYEFGIPIYDATSSTAKVTVSCTQPWGTCPVGGSVRVPTAAHPSTGSDKAMVVIDWTANTSYEFWQAQKMSTKVWQTSWGAKVTDVINGTGLGGGSSTATNMSRLGGVIRMREIAAGTISHALVFSSNQTCQTTFRYPAAKTDGQSTAAGCIPEGARIQLDPSININAISGITAGEKAIAKALQTYGAYVVDSGGSRVGLSFELDPTATATRQLPAAYTNAGLAWDYFQMSHIPWTSVRVLATWDGVDSAAPTAPASVTATGAALTWNAATDNVGVAVYNVWRGDSNYANWVQIGQVSGATLSFTDTSAVSGSSYTYAVRAVDAAGNISTSSNTVFVTVP